MSHNSKVNIGFEAETGLAPLFASGLKEMTLATISNGHTKVHVTSMLRTRFDTWNVQGDLSFDSPLLPSDPIELLALLDTAITDILRDVVKLEIAGRTFEMTRFTSLSWVFVYRSDEYKLPGEGLTEMAAKLLRQEMAFHALVMGHLYDAANRILFGLDDPYVPTMERLFLRCLPRDEALHRMFFDEARTGEVRKGMQQVNFLCQTAEELLIKPKDERTMN